jgi:FtsZ-interacting cell division protein ZipA
MSVEAPKTVEETPVVDATKALPEQPEVAAAPVETAAAPVEATSAEETPAVATEETAAATEEVKKDETAAETVPTSEGTLGYKEAGFLKYVACCSH